MTALQSCVRSLIRAHVARPLQLYTTPRWSHRVERLALGSAAAASALRVAPRTRSLQSMTSARSPPEYGVAVAERMRLSDMDAMESLLTEPAAIAGSPG